MNRHRHSPLADSHSNVRSCRQFKNTKHPKISPFIAKALHAAPDLILQILTKAMLASESVGSSTHCHYLNASTGSMRWRGDDDIHIFDKYKVSDRSLPLHASSPQLVSVTTTKFVEIPYTLSTIQSAPALYMSYTCPGNDWSSLTTWIDTDRSKAFAKIQIDSVMEKEPTTPAGMHAMFGIYKGASIAPNKFMLFPMLPSELRLRIWHFALPQRRVVGLKYDRYNACRRRSVARIPAMLHVCAESRFEALRYYRLTFGYSIAQIKRYTMEDATYFDPSVDVLYLSCTTLREYSARFGSTLDATSMMFLSLLAGINGVSQVRSLAMCQEMWKKIVDWNSSGALTATWRGSLKSLEEAILTKHDHSLCRKDLHLSELVGRDEKGDVAFDFPAKASLNRLIGFDLRAAVLTNNSDDGATLPAKQSKNQLHG